MSTDVNLSVPAGVYTALNNLATKDVEHLTLLGEAAYNQVFPSDKGYRQLQEQELNIRNNDEVAALSYLYRNAFKLGLTSEKFEKQLQSNTAVSSSLVKVIITIWNQKESIRKSEALNFINVGKHFSKQMKDMASAFETV